MKYFSHPFIAAFLSVCLAACGGAPHDSGPAAETVAAGEEEPVVQAHPVDDTPNADEPQQALQPKEPGMSDTRLALTGLVSFDRVPFQSRTYRGLDYDETLAVPARGLTVQLLSGNGSVIASTQTTSNGEYRFTVAKNSDVRLRVLAELRGTGVAAWDILVKDNTNGNAIYALDGSLANTGDGNSQVRNLHAASGWTGSSYADARSAAPFAILDSIYDAVTMVVSADPNVVLPPLDVFWSENNIAIYGSLPDGHIGTSFYTSHGPSIYLLGAADNDSDEYDRAIVQHEFGHYLEHQLGRTESIGGSHNQSSKLDMRVAFGEAWGNAFAGMASGDPIYRDSLGKQQSSGFAINVNTRSYGTQGWFSEASIQVVLYSLFDDLDSYSDRVSLGFKPIYDVLTSDAYLNFDGLASIYPFIHLLKQHNPQQQTQIDALVQSFNIYGTGMYGEGESNSADSAITLPHYHQLAVGQTVNLCSDSVFQDYNGVDVRRFAHIKLPQTRSYDIDVIKTGGDMRNANPQVRIYRNGNHVTSLLSVTPNVEYGRRHLDAGTYVFEVYEQRNADGSNYTGGFVCFDMTVN